MGSLQASNRTIGVGCIRDMFRRFVHEHTWQGFGSYTLGNSEHCQGLPTYCDQRQVEPMMRHYEGVCLPAMLTKQPPLSSDMDEEDLADILEWLGMVSIESPRYVILHSSLIIHLAPCEMQDTSERPCESVRLHVQSRRRGGRCRRTQYTMARFIELTIHTRSVGCH